MREQDTLLIILFLLFLILIIYLASAKAERRRITITNQDGSSVNITAEIAASLPVQMKGLMGRKSLGQDDGMLFVFNASGYPSFWMLNTTIPLDAIFFDDNGTVVDILQMAPCGFNITKCPTYAPKAPARYVLEVNQGQAKDMNITIGKSRLGLPY